MGTIQNNTLQGVQPPPYETKYNLSIFTFQNLACVCVCVWGGGGAVEHMC